jgi:DNA-binding transcriptional LysR family regulator
MDWDDVRVFLAVARAQGLTGAARGLKTSPQTVGRRVAALEAAIGSPLFLRGPTGYQLTEDGRALLTDAERIEQDVARFSASASGRSTTLAGTVRLTAPETFVTFLLLPAMAPFIAHHSELRIEFCTGSDTVSMSRGEADLALRLIRPESGDLKLRRIGAMSNALYAAPGYLDVNPAAREHPLESARLIGWADTRTPICRPLAGSPPGSTAGRISPSRTLLPSVRRYSPGWALPFCLASSPTG